MSGGPTTYVLGPSQSVSFTVSSPANSTAAPAPAGLPGEALRTYRLYATSACRVWRGVAVDAANPPAGDAGFPLPADSAEYVDLRPGERFSALGIAASGALTVTLASKPTVA